MTVIASRIRQAAAAMMEAVRASAADPADAVRVLLRIVMAPPPPVSPLPGVGAMQMALAAMLRRCALVSLGRACASYRPVSSTDAAGVRRAVMAVFDTEILVAADGGDFASYRALRLLRTRVSADLAARGTALPGVVTVQLPQSDPSLVVAWRLYGDVRREPLMVARAGAAHPMFMPPQFEALDR